MIAKKEIGGEGEGRGEERERESKENPRRS